MAPWLVQHLHLMGQALFSCSLPEPTESERQLMYDAWITLAWHIEFPRFASRVHHRTLKVAQLGCNVR
jgi:hypothetical protein